MFPVYFPRSNNPEEARWPCTVSLDPPKQNTRHVPAGDIVCPIQSLGTFISCSVTHQRNPGSPRNGPQQYSCHAQWSSGSSPLEGVAPVHWGDGFQCLSAGAMISSLSVIEDLRGIFSWLPHLLIQIEKNAYLSLLKNVYWLVDFKERGKERERETLICCSTYLCIH